MLAIFSGWNCGRRRAGAVTGQISLTCSNGSPHERQRRSALQAVAPNSLSSTVSVEPHSGQAAVRRGGAGGRGGGGGGGGGGPPAPAGPGAGRGGPPPPWASWRRPASLIQSVVQAGD